MDKYLNIPGKQLVLDREGGADFDLALVLFEEDGISFCYCPALDIAGYGYNDKEAQDSFEITLHEYFDYTAKEGTLIADITRLGWHFSKTHKNKVVPPKISALINKNEEFKRIINSYPVKTIYKSSCLHSEFNNQKTWPDRDIIE